MSSEIMQKHLLTGAELGGAQLLELVSLAETLRQDCPNQLVTGEVAWPNAIALTNPSEPTVSFRDQIEKKMAELIAGYSAESKPRTERVVGLYGIFVSPSGLALAPCCRGAVETSMAPARLVGVAEHDFRVIR